MPNRSFAFRKADRHQVRAVFDSEAVKNRRFWPIGCWPNAAILNAMFFGETKRCERAKWPAQDVFRERTVGRLSGIAAVECSSTRILCNSPPSHSLLELTNASGAAKCAGISAVRYDRDAFSRLAPALGRGALENWCLALAANKPLVVDGNSVVV